MMRSDRKGLDGYLRQGLALSLILYALACPISRSVNYFPLGLIILFAMCMWIRGNGMLPASGTLIWLGGIWLSLMVWRCFTIFVNGEGFTLSPILKTFNVLPIFLLYRVPGDADWKERQAANALFVLLFVTAITIILGIFQKVSGLDYPLPEQPFQEGKLVGFLGGHIHAGGFFSTLAVLSICLVIFWRTSAGTKIFLVALLSVLVAGILLSMSRTYYISLLAVLPFILLRKSLKATFIGIALLAVLIGGAFLFSQAIRERAMSITDLKKNPSNVERLYLWRVARDTIIDNPVAGIGFKRWGKNLDRYAGRYAAEWQFTPAALHHAHNVYLSVAAETGLVGLTLFLGFWLYLLYLIFRTAGDASNGSLASALALGASFGLLNLLIGGFFEENFGSTAVNIFVVSFLVALAFFVKEERKTAHFQTA